MTIREKAESIQTDESHSADTERRPSKPTVVGSNPTGCATVPVNAGLLARFWPKVDRRGPLECWPWTASSLTTYGYGHIRLTSSRRKVLSHRLAYELANGPIPDGLKVLHECDNPPCCNPAHLFLGTHLANARDRDSKGRQRKQESATRKLRRLRDEQLAADEAWRLP